MSELCNLLDDSIRKLDELLKSEGLSKCLLASSIASNLASVKKVLMDAEVVPAEDGDTNG